MLDQMSNDALVKACQNKLQVVVNYQKKTTGEFVSHTVGVQEIGVNNKTGEPCLWGWDVMSNDHIRCFLLAYITGIEVLNIPYVNMTGYPIKINGVELGY